MRPVAGPDVIGGVVNHGCPDWVEFNISLASQQISFVLNDARFEPAFIKRTGSLVLVIEIANVMPAQELHGARNSGRAGRGHQQVNMVCHEHPGMDVDAEP